MVSGFLQRGDPLLKLLYQKYDVNLLSIPRELISIGDVYMYDGNKDRRLKEYGTISSFFTSQFDIPAAKTENLANEVSETISKATSIELGVKFLEGFLNLLTPGTLGTKIFGNLGWKNAESVRFQFSRGTREFTRPADFGSKMGNYIVDQGNALYNPEDRYFLVTSILRSPSVSVYPEESQEKVFEIGVNAADIAKASNAIEIDYSRKGQIVFAGQKPLAFAVQLYELEYDSNNERIRMKSTREYYKVLEAGQEQERVRQKLKAAYLGDPAEDDIFIQIYQ